MVPRPARPSRSLRHRCARLGAQIAASLCVTLGGAIILTSSPASAATSPTTDTITLVENYTTTLSASLPPGTPDVVTPVATALYDLCAPYSGDTLETLDNSSLEVCDTIQFGPASDEVVVAGVGSSVGVILPVGQTNNPPDCGVAAYVGSSGVVLAPPGPPSC